MKNLFLLLFSILIVQLTAQQKRVLKPFSTLSISTNIDATLVQSDHYRMDYTILSGDESSLKVSEKNGELNITTKSKGLFSGSNAKVKMTIYCRDLKEIDLSAGASLKSDGELSIKDLEVEVSSGGLAILELLNEKCEVDVSSGGSLTLRGVGNKVKAEASSGGAFNGVDFRTKDADTEVSSGGTIKVWCTNSIKADASSGGSIKYKGEPQNITTDAGFSGSVGKM